MNLPIGAALKSLAHSAAATLPLLPGKATKFVQCGMMPAAVFMAGVHASGEYAEYAAGMDEQPYQTLMKVGSFITTFALFHRTSHLRRGSVILHSVFGLQISLILVGVTRVFRDTLVPQQDRATWGNITVSSCPFVDYLANGQEFLQRIVSGEFFAQFTKPGALISNGRVVTFNFVEVTSSLCVTVLPLAILTAMAVEHLFSLKRIFSTGKGKEFILHDLAMILPLVDYLGRHGVYLPLKDRGTRDGVDRGIDFAMNYTQNRGIFADTGIAKWIQTRINLIKKYELSESVIPILQLYYAPIIGKVIFAIGLLKKHLPEEVFTQLWLSSERTVFNLISTVASLVHPNPHFGHLEEEMPLLVIKLRQMLRNMGLLSMNPVLMIRETNEREQKAAGKIGKNLTIKGAPQPTREKKLADVRYTMQRGDCFRRPPVSAGAGQVLGQALHFNLGELIGNTGHELAQLIPDVVQKITTLFEAGTFDEKTLDQIMDTFLSNKMLNIAVGSARQMLTQNEGVVLPPSLGLRHELLANPEDFFAVPPPEAPFDELFVRAQKAVSSMNTPPEWLSRSILEGKLKERLASASASLPEKAAQLRTQASMFCHALCEQLKEDSTKLLEYIGNNDYITGNLKEERCSEQAEGLFEQLNFAATAFLSNQDPHMVQFLLEAHERRHDRMHALFAQQQYLIAKCLGAANGFVGVGEHLVYNMPPLPEVPPFLSSLDSVLFMMPMVRMGIGFLQETTLDGATNVHQVNQALKRFLAHNNESLFQTKMALELPTWVLDALHGPAETLTYKKLLRAGLGDIFSSQLLPESLKGTVEIDAAAHVPLYPPHDQMQILETAVMLHQFELMISELVKAKKTPAEKAAYQKKLELRAQEVRRGIQHAIEGRREELKAWRQSNNLPEEVLEEIRLQKLYQKALDAEDTEEANRLEPQLLRKKFIAAMQVRNIKEVNRLRPLLEKARQAKAQTEVPVWDELKAKEARTEALRRLLDSAMDALLPTTVASAPAEEETPDVDQILDRLRAQSRIASCAATFFRCARCHERGATWNQTHKDWGMSIFFHTLSGLEWCAYGHSEQRLMQWHESEDSFIEIVKGCPNAAEWKEKETTLVAVSEHLSDYFNMVMGPWAGSEWNDKRGSIQHILMHELVPLIAECGMDLVEEAVAQQKSEGSDESYEIVSVSTDLALDDEALRKKREKAQKAVELIAEALPDGITLKDILLVLTQSTEASGVYEALPKVSITELCILHQGVQHAGDFWTSAFRTQYGELQKVFDKRVGPAVMVLLELATPRPGKEMSPPENQTGFAVKNVAAPKTLSRKGVLAAPGLYQHLLIGKADQLFAFKPWQQMAAGLAPQEHTSQSTNPRSTSPASSTPDAPEPIISTLGKVAKKALDLMARAFEVLRFNLLSEMGFFIQYKKRLDRMNEEQLCQAGHALDSDNYEVKLTLSADQVGSFIRELSHLFSSLPSSLSFLISDWSSMCALLAERYEAKPVELTMVYCSNNQSLQLVDDPNTEPMTLPPMSITDTFDRIRFEEMTAAFVQKEAFRAEGLEPPQLLGWADLCNMFYTFTGDKEWIQTRDACLHRIDTSKADKATLAAMDRLAKDGDLTDVGALKSQYSQLKGTLNTSSQALPVITRVIALLAQIRELWQKKSSISSFVEQLSEL